MATLLKAPSETNILIVDDKPDNLRLLTKILEPQGYTVRKSLSGRMAIQGAHRDPPDLILLDINMPQMTGYEVCQELKASAVTAAIPIIFISALDQIQDKVRAFEMGAADYISKPFHGQEVLMRVKNQLLLQQQHRQLEQQHRQLLEQNQRLEQEIKERVTAEAVIRKLSLTDDLTGLFNRRGFGLMAWQQLKLAWRTRTPCCILFADLDGLKPINDTLGHKTGDRVITSAAQVLRQTFRETDILARWGGDEFVVFIPLYADNVDDLKTRFQVNIDTFNQNSQLEWVLSISFGLLNCVLDETTSLDLLITQADNLMYEQKRAKRALIS